MLQKGRKNNLGPTAETYASDFLVKNGYKVIDRNFHSRFGEIDIIALKDGYLVFVEVKARFSLKYGLPEEAVTPTKLFKIKKTGEYYSLLHSELPKKLRIDVVALIVNGPDVVSAKIIVVD
ncbi:MAG TPA: YraN family protein [Patescibacteria group bacterium]|nr:YraN family protein [Patescibacteria group bacterium]